MQNISLKLADGLMIRKIGADVVVFPQKNPFAIFTDRLMYFTDVASDIIARIDGFTNLSTIVDELIKLYDTDPLTLKNDVEAFIVDLQKSGILHEETMISQKASELEHKASSKNISYGYFCKELEDKAIENFIPLWGTLELTHRCNLKCVHCYLGKPHKSDELSTHEVINILSELHEAGCLFLVITGGEPLLREDFPIILQAAKERGFLIFLFTNGTLIDNTAIELLSKYPPLSVDISLYGISEEVYKNTTRTTQGREDVIEAIKNLTSCGINVRVKTPLLKINDIEIEEMYRFCNSLGIEFTHNAGITPIVNGECSPCNLRVQPKRVVELDINIQQRRETYLNCPEAFHKLKPSDRLLLCRAGRSLFCIDPSGKLETCVLFREPKFDLRENTFKESWSKLNKYIDNLRPNGKYKCGNCELLSYCTPCPGWAKWEYGIHEAPIEYLCNIAKERRQYFQNLKGGEK